MDELEELRIELNKKRIEQEALLKEAERLNKLKEMPFYLRIQTEGNIEQLKRVEETLKWAMELGIKKHYPKLKGQEQELFAEFFTEFLEGKCKSINDFMNKSNYSREDG